MDDSAFIVLGARSIGLLEMGAAGKWYGPTHFSNAEAVNVKLLVAVVSGAE